VFRIENKIGYYRRLKSAVFNSDMSKNRRNLPFRKNCGGYFLDGKGKIFAQKNEQGLIIFPGGGIDAGESVEQEILRETFEETGAKIINLKKLGNIKFIWGSNWAKTEKQKKRFQQFQGDDMYFFSGIVQELTSEKLTEEDSWKKNLFLGLDEVIETIASGQPFDKEIKEYRETQLKFLKVLKDRYA